jgi:transcriptional regulator with XRE-family HTH domain
MFEADFESDIPAPSWRVNRIRYFLDDPPPVLWAGSLDEYRTQHSLTLKQLAGYLGISTSTLRAWTRGKVPRPSERERVGELLSKPPTASPPPGAAVAAVPSARCTPQADGEINEGVARLLAAWLDRLPPDQQVSLDDLEGFAMRIKAALQG